MFNSLQPQGLETTRLLCPWNTPGKNTGVGCHALLQGIFPTQGWNQHLLHLMHLQAGSLPLAPPGTLPSAITKWKHNSRKAEYNYPLWQFSLHSGSNPAPYTAFRCHISLVTLSWFHSPPLSMKTLTCVKSSGPLSCATRLHLCLLAGIP